MTLDDIYGGDMPYGKYTIAKLIRSKDTTSFPFASMFIKLLNHKMKDANGVILFVDDNNNITGGQMSCYTLDDGLRGYYLDQNGNIVKPFERRV